MTKVEALGSAPFKWTKRAIRLEAIKYNSRSEFHQKSSGAYGAATKKNILNEVCKHMSTNRKPNGYWTKERLLSTVDSCKTVKEFRENHSAAYDATLRSEFKNEILDKLNRAKKANFFWNKKNILLEAKKYSSRSEFLRKSAGALHHFTKSLT